MPSTFTKLQTITLPSNQTSFSFNSISQAYTDLVITSNVFSPTAGGVGLSFVFNSDSTASYVFIYMYGTGSGNMSSGRNPNSTFMNLGNASTIPSSHIINIQNYSNTSTYKSAISRASLSSYDVTYAGSWFKNNAITDILVRLESGANMSAGSTFTLYGILAA